MNTYLTAHVAPLNKLNCPRYCLCLVRTGGDCLLFLILGFSDILSKIDFFPCIIAALASEVLKHSYSSPQAKSLYISVTAYTHLTYVNSTTCVQGNKKSARAVK